MNTNEILEALTETIQEIDSKYQKMHYLKNLLIANQRASPVPKPNSYLERYKQTHKKNTMSLRNLAAVTPERKISVVFQDSYDQDSSESDDMKSFINLKENEIREKAERLKTEEKKVLEAENRIKYLEKEIKYQEKAKNSELLSLNHQLSYQVCRNIIHEILVKIMNQSESKKTSNIYIKKKEITDHYSKVAESVNEIERIKNEFKKELLDYQANFKSLQDKEDDLDKTLDKLKNDAKLLQDSKHNFTLKQKEEHLKSRENAALARLKELNHQKQLLDSRSQRTSIPPKSPVRSAKSESIRESKLAEKEQKLKEAEEQLAIEEAEVEAKRKKITEKWEKIITKVDDINKQELKASNSNLEIEEKYHEFNLYKKETEAKLRIQESLLANQEIALLKKISKLEGELEFKQFDSLEENCEDDFRKGFIERQNARKKELEDLSNEKKQISRTISSFLSELN